MLKYSNLSERKFKFSHSQKSDTFHVDEFQFSKYVGTLFFKGKLKGIHLSDGIYMCCKSNSFIEMVKRRIINKGKSTITQDCNQRISTISNFIKKCKIQKKKKGGGNGIIFRRSLEDKPTREKKRITSSYCQKP